MKLTPIPAEIVSCPMIGEAPVSLECKVVEVKELPSHDMFMAEIVKIHVDKSVMDEDGRIALDKAGMLAYVHGEYFGVKKAPIGRFGFSVMKKKTKKRINREKHQKRIEANRNQRKKKG